MTVVLRILGSLLGLAFVVLALFFAGLGECTLHPFMEYRTSPDPTAETSAYVLFGFGAAFLVLAVLIVRCAWRRRAEPAPPPDAG
jgi:hypothetical protein